MSRRKNKDKRDKSRAVVEEAKRVQKEGQSGISEQPPKKVKKVKVRKAVGKVVFTPYAWAKLLWFRYRSESEVSGFGVSSVDDPLYVVDFVTVKQTVTGVTTQMDDMGVADYFADMDEKGLQPCEYGRIWIHTHPGMGVTPSGVDESCFADVFGRCDWSIMMIVGGEKGTQQVYCRLGFNVGPGTAVSLATEIDWTAEFSGSDYEAWEAEYKRNVTEDHGMYGIGGIGGIDTIGFGAGAVGQAGERFGGSEDAYAEVDVDEVEEGSPQYCALWTKAMGGDSQAIGDLLMMPVEDVRVLQAKGFEPGQILWYDAEIYAMEPGDLDQYEEEQRIACANGYSGYVGDYNY